MAGKRRPFGAIRKLPSGRYQVRYRTHGGAIKPAPRTFARKEEAANWLTLAEAQMMTGEWIDPSRGKVQLSAYAERWIKERPRLRPRTVELYELLLRRHVVPYLGDVEIGKVTTPMVRSWRATLAVRSSESMAAKAYRLLRAVLNTAVKEDELIRVNPCRVPGADKEHTAERPVLSVAQVLKLADAMPERFRALVMLSTFACLRWGEAIALQRADVDLAARTVTVSKAYSELAGDVMEVGPTKSRAGMRTVCFPAFVVPYLVEHLDKFTPQGDRALIFTGGRGGALRRSNFRSTTKWATTCTALGFGGLHFHDLRHTGNTLASQTGTSLKDLMARMGHDSPRAALIYQHASAGADRAVAEALDALLTIAENERASKQTGPDEGEPDDDDGASGVPVPAS